jgi:hypothetical protein
MSSKNFERILRAYQTRKPFRPYRVRFVDGEYIDVYHPEALVTRGGTAIFFDRDDVPTLFDFEGVSEVIGEANSRKAKS